MKLPPRQSYLEASARQRLAALLDANSFTEFLPPTLKRISPHLGMFDAPVAFDDGVIVGSATLNGHRVFVFAQEGKFRGGALGEVHASKIIGLLKRALRDKPAAVVGLFDSGGVRLEEANAGEIGASEIIRATLDCRTAGIPVIGLIGGSTGCFGGASLIAASCDTLISSEQGRLSVSGPEVIETVMGVEAFDSRDRALVWRTTGGKNRYIFGTIHELVDDHIPAFRKALEKQLKRRRPITLKNLRAQNKELQERITLYGKAKDARDAWKKMKLPADSIPAMATRDLDKLLKQNR